MHHECSMKISNTFQGISAVPASRRKCSTDQSHFLRGLANNKLCADSPRTALGAQAISKKGLVCCRSISHEDRKDLTRKQKSAQREFNPRSSQQASKTPPVFQSKSQDPPPNHELTSGHCLTRGIQPTATDNTCGAQLHPCSDL